VPDALIKVIPEAPGIRSATSPTSLDAMVADLGAITGQVGAAEVCLLGQYNSCPHTIAYAARHPERSWTTSMGWARR
jgi:hypothetical protein